MAAVIQFLDKLAKKGIKLAVKDGQLTCFAPKGSLTDEVKNGIVHFKPRILSLLDDQLSTPKPALTSAQTMAGTGALVANGLSEFPLSVGEKGLYILQTLEPQMSAYNVPLCFRSKGNIEVEILNQAWGYVLEQYPILTTRVVEKDGVLFHCLDDACKTTIACQSLDITDEARLITRLKADAKKPFDLDHGPLCRINWYPLPNGEAILLICVHHMVFDGSSALILLSTLLDFYQTLSAGKAITIDDSIAGYQAFVQWEQQMLSSAQGYGHAQYWRQQLQGELPQYALLPNAAKKPSQGQQRYRGEVFVADLPPPLAQWVNDFAKSQFLSTSAIFLALYKLLLNKYANIADIVVGMPVMGRAQRKFARDIGYFINMIPLRSDLSENQDLLSYIKQVQKTLMTGLVHSAYPYPLIVEQHKSTNGDNAELFQVSYAYQNFMQLPDEQSPEKALGIETMEGLYQEGNIDLGFEVYEGQNRFNLHFKYNPDMYPQAVVERFYQHLCQLLEAICQDSGLPVQQYPMISEAEKATVLSQFNQTEGDYPKNLCVHQLFVEQAKLHPNTIAVVDQEQQLTFKQLAQRSRKLALYLQQAGVGPDTVVGVSLYRSVDMMVAILGVLQAGGAYVPLDPDFPDERLSFMVQNAEASLVLSHQQHQPRLTPLFGDQASIICLDSQWSQIDQAKGKLKTTVKPHHLVYVIYTSGSTGKPKGVMIEHRALVDYCYSAYNTMALADCQSYAAVSTFAADLGNTTLFLSMLFGKTLHLIGQELVQNPIELVRYFAANPVDCMKYTPSHFEMFTVSESQVAMPEKVLILAGEALTPKVIQAAKKAKPNCLIFNNYGPTETTVSKIASTALNDLVLDTIYLGKPLNNTQMYILDRCDNLQPIGVPGELHIAGDGLARGYLNRPDLTAQAFVANPFNPGSLMYKTGDLTRWLADGNIEYLGRIDSQVKIRGFRIEVGEIEAQLARYEDIKVCAVVVQGQDNHRQLVAFYQAQGANEHKRVEILPDKLKQFLAQGLPDYMIPVAFVPLANLPLTANGKVDRLALVRMDVHISSNADYVAPRTVVEKQLATIFADLLKVDLDKVGCNEHFFELGGHSLLATQLLSRIRTTLSVELRLKALFDHPTVAGLARQLADAQKSDVQVISPVSRDDIDQLPLSYAQERVWFIDQLEPGNTSYNMPGAVTISGDLDVDQMAEALNVIIQRHENLRTVFPSIDGVPRQQILDQLILDIERIDLRHCYTEQERQIRARRICLDDAARPFDLNHGPLLRAKVIKLAPTRHILMFNMHHIIADGWSIGVFVREFAQVTALLQKDALNQLRPLPLQYLDYSVWQRALLEQGGVLEQQLSYWQQQLRGLPETLDLACDYQRGKQQSFVGDRCQFTLDAQLSSQLNQLTERHSCTLFMTLLAAFKVLLFRYSGEQDLCVGSPIANRHYGETENLIGMFVNTLALRSFIDENDHFEGLLEKVKDTCLDAYAHQDAPFEKVVERVQPVRNMAVTPLFQVMLIVQNTPMDALDGNIERFELPNNVAKFDLLLEFRQVGDELQGSLDYCTALYRRPTVERLIQHFINLCRAIVAAPRVGLGDLDYLQADEKRQLLFDFNQTACDFPDDKCIHQFFIEQAINGPDKLALVYQQQQLSYGQLYDQCFELAMYLQSIGVKKDILVGLCVERSPEMMIGIMAIVMAGGAYVPLDPTLPDDRLAYMVDNAQVPIVLTQARFSQQLKTLVGEGTEILALDSQWQEVAECCRSRKAEGIVLNEDVGPDNLNYMIYTSGSTGRPKGVLIEHRALVNRIHWMQKRYPIGSDDIVLQKTPYSFDVSVWEFFWPMMQGATVVFAQPGGHTDVFYLAELINQAKVTTLHFVPSMLRAFLDNAAVSCPWVKQVFCSGEALDKKCVDDYHGFFPNAKLHNLYGPTEAAIDVTSYDCSQLKLPIVPIGKPIDNIQIYVLDQYLQPVPVGVPGELYIAGVGLARSYLNRPELNQQTFINNPFNPAQRMYKSGDLARWMNDGNIEYLGRIDNQVKIRGLRIELGEIEANLALCQGVQDCVVVPKGQAADKQLVAFYLSRNTLPDKVDELPTQWLKDHLKLSLPEYMIPAAFVSLAKIPLTPNGKVDRKALVLMDVQMHSQQSYVAPSNPTELALTQIWAQLLQKDPQTIGVHDSFFELGGHSLLATRLMSRVRHKFGVDLPLKILFEHHHIHGFAQLLHNQAQSKLPAIVPVERSTLTQLPLSFAQQRLWFIDQLTPGRADYNMAAAVRITGPLDIELIEQAFGLIIHRHDNLRTVFPSHSGQAEQRIIEDLPFTLARHDVSRYKTGKTRDSHAKKLCLVEAATPFDLSEGPLIRAMVIKQSSEQHILMLNMHHIISDGWSLSVFIREFGVILDALTTKQPLQLPPLKLQYLDYSVWQRTWLEQGGTLSQQLDYWQQKLQGVPQRLELAYDYPRPAMQSYAGANETFMLDSQLSEQLKDFAKQHTSTLFMVLLAAFKVLLYRYSGEEDICVGSPIAGRHYGETEGLIGMFVNTLALRDHLLAEHSFEQVLASVKTTCLEAYANQDAPFEQIVDLVRKKRDLSATPLFQIAMALQNVPAAPGKSNIAPFVLENHISKFDLTLEFSLNESDDQSNTAINTKTGLRGSIQYSTALFKPQTIKRMISHFIALTQQLLAQPQAAIDQLQYIEAKERALVLEQFNQTASAYPDDCCIHHLVERSGQLYPNNIAVEYGDEQLNYQQLLDNSGVLAGYLQSQGVGPDVLVALCLPKSVNMVVAILAVLRAGGAYVPIDPNYPEERLAHLLTDANAAIILLLAPLKAKITPLLAHGTKVVALDQDWPLIQTNDKIRFKDEVTPEHLAYVIYTSGSTGKPKGVLVNHRGLQSLCHWHQTTFGVDQHSIASQTTSISFDAAGWDIWPYLSCGARVVLIDSDRVMDVAALHDTLARHNCSHSFLITPVAQQLLQLPTLDLPKLQYLLTGGDKLSQYVHQDRRFTVVNNYGPTESTVVTTSAIIDAEHPVSAIGKPINNTRVYIVDKHLNPVPVGVPGELMIASVGLARGYLNRDDLTEQTFIDNPFGAGKVYRSGDLVRWLPDGHIEFLSRIDNQVKVRGFRIELGEIEHQLASHDRISDCSVVVQENNGNKQLVAFYVSPDEVPLAELKAHLLEVLPEFMLPAAFVLLAQIPLTPNGKVDRRHLQAMDVSFESTMDYVAPRNDMEKQLVDIWAELLQLDATTIGIHDNFFERGGHSLLATRLMSSINTLLGIDLSLKALFERPTIAQISTQSANQTTDPSATTNLPQISVFDRSQFDHLPLSFAQQRLWFIEQLSPGSASYNIPGVVSIDGKIDIPLLQQALNIVVARHESLRTEFIANQGRPEQVIIDKLELVLEVIDVSELGSEQQRQHQAKQHCLDEAATAFDLSCAPLLRAKIIKLADEQHLFMVNMHHIIADGWSVRVLIKEFAAVSNALSEGKAVNLPLLPIQYVDYALWQRHYLESSDQMKQQLAYWQQKLQGVTESINVATDWPRPKKQSFAGAVAAFHIEPELMDKLKMLAQAQRCTLYMTLLAMFKVLLYRYTGQHDICVGSPIANRQYAPTQGLIGMFVNTLALRDQLDGSQSFNAILGQVKATCLAAYECQDVPFEWVVDAVVTERDMALTPLFQVMFVLQTGLGSGPTQQIKPYALDKKVSKFDLTMELVESAAGLSGSIEYCTALYRPSTIERLAGHFVSLCELVCRDAHAPVGTIDYLPEQQRKQLLQDFNNHSVSYDKDVSIADRVAAMAQLYPDKVAVVEGNKVLSYQHLLQRADKLARYLQSKGVGRETKVVLCVERSIDMVVGLLGILRSGGAYVPVDPNYPQQRLAYLLQDSDAKVVLTQHQFKSQLRKLTVKRALLLAIDKPFKVSSKALTAKTNSHGEDLAYVIYTSGSTGNPKGVMVNHQSLHGLCAWHQHSFAVDAQSKASQTANIAFDAATWEIWPYLSCGASLHLVDQDTVIDPVALSGQLKAQQISHCFLVTPVAQHLLQDKRLHLPALKYLLLGGDKLSQFDNRDYGFTVVNNYGPTEATVVTTSHKIGPDSSLASIGKPIANIRVYIVDEQQNLVPLGVPGELCIGGSALARGYLNRDDLTALAFVDNPFASGERMYKSGDLACWREDGQIEYLGRIDTQVKIRGFRIEIAEIEAQLSQHDAVKDSVVVVKGEGANKQLAAFYQSHSGEPLDTQTLRGHLNQYLPEYMVPKAFVSLPSIPMTPNGKVDRKAVAQLSVDFVATEQYMAPRNNDERQLVAIWAEVLQLEADTVGVMDSFFELGGNSLLAVKLIAQINAAFRQNLALAQLFSAPDIASLAQMLTCQPSNRLLVPLQPLGEQQAIFAIPGAGGNVLSFAPMAKMLGFEQPFYGLQGVGLDGQTLPLDSVEQTAKSNIAAIKVQQPVGPYRLLGHSYGGVVAFEMARQLQQAGEHVNSLILLDTLAPNLYRSTEPADDVNLLVELGKAFGANCDVARLTPLDSAQRLSMLTEWLNQAGVKVTLAQVNAAYGVFKANEQCYRDYQGARFDGRSAVTLITAKGSGAWPADRGWQDLMAAPLTPVAVETDHFSMLADAKVVALVRDS